MSKYLPNWLLTWKQMKHIRGYYQKIIYYYRKQLQQYQKEIRNYQQLIAHYEKQMDILNHDAGTNLLTKRAIMNHLNELASNANLIIVIGDIDHFKQVNDQYGHLVGDAALAQIGSLLTKFLASHRALGARFGGEEFLLIFKETELEKVYLAIENLRSQIAHTIFFSETQPFSLTLSFGISCCKTPMTIKEGIDQADQALYQAKSSGRNQTIIYSNKIKQLIHHPYNINKSLSTSR